MKTFADIYIRAAHRHGGAAKLEQKLLENDHLKTPNELAAIPDDRYLSQMTKCVFQAGFNWQVIENKWAGFEAAFRKFDIDACAFLSDDAVDELAKDTRIVRNRPKIMTVPANARFIRAVREEAGSFGRFLADWPADDQIGLMSYLQEHGSRLGGKTGQYFLRFSGWDGYVLSKDGTAALIDAGVVDSNPVSGKGAFKKTQNAMTAWHKDTGYSYSKISRILALSIDS